MNQALKIKYLKMLLLGKIISIFYFQIFWKPYYLFSRGFHKSTWLYWKGMMPYFLIFFVFGIVSIAFKLLLIDNYEPSWPSLLALGLTIVPIILILYFLSLFIFTRGMKYFVARKPAAYNLMSKLTIIN